MCLGAIHWARIARVYYALDRSDAAQMGFADADLFADVARAPSDRTIPMLRKDREVAIPLVTAWQSKTDRRGYGPPVSGGG
jgi:tRNA(Arg) A34 adenosine deaminase TadA